MTTAINVHAFSAGFVEQLNANFAAIDAAVDRLDAGVVAGRSSYYTTMYDSAGVEVVKCGNAGDPANYFSNDSHNFYNRAVNGVFARLNAVGLCVGGAPTYARLECIAADGTSLLGLRGTTKGLRVRSSPVGCAVEGVDGTLVASFQPLFLNGSYTALQAQGASVAVAEAGALRPAADNAVSCGASFARWSVVYAATGAINTSGRDAKVGIRGPSDAERRAARRILSIGPRLYRFRDAVEAKGDAARLHAGYVAEDVRDALLAEGLDPWRYGFLCADPVLQTESFRDTSRRPKVRPVRSVETTIEVRDGRAVQVPHEVVRDEPVGSLLPVVDADGRPVLRESRDGNCVVVQVPTFHFEPEYEVVEQVRTREVATGETRLGLRYGELEAFLKCAG